MRHWQKEALKVFREARAFATRTSDPRLHQACGRAIEAMVAAGGMVPSELRIYAQQIRNGYGDPATLPTRLAATRMMGRYRCMTCFQLTAKCHS
jgi:hypothetical protein